MSGDLTELCLYITALVLYVMFGWDVVELRYLLGAPTGKGRVIGALYG